MNKTKKAESNPEKESRATQKKLNGKSKLALERIYRLFELAIGNEKYSKRYLQLAKRIGEKCRVSVPKEIKRKYCKKCYSLKIITTEEKPFLITKCTECGFEKKYSLKEK
ncbi:MAG: ribonuclease P [archaeon]|jgi:ribonuclease P protein subunit RPR2